MASDDELKDEELVDFEGSDYESGFDYDEELEALEKEQKAIDHPQEDAANVDGDYTTRRFETSPSSDWQQKYVSETLETSQISIPDPLESVHMAEVCNNSQSGCAVSVENLIEERVTRKGAESKGIEVERDSEMEDGKDVDGNGRHFVRNGSKPELEDGELDETAMSHNHEHDPEDDKRNGIDGPERKRRKTSVTLEKKVNIDAERNCSKEIEETNLEEGQRSGSIRTMQKISGPPSSVGRVLNMRMAGLAQGSLTPGLVGPGVSPAPFAMARGFGLFGRFGTHGRPSLHPQEILAQEHILRARALHLTHENLATAMMNPIARPLGGGTLNPFLGLDSLPPRPQIPKHFLQRPELLPGPVENLVRGQRPVLGMGRSSPTNKPGVQTEISGIVRPLNWTGSSVSAVLQCAKNRHMRGPGIRGGVRRGSGSLNAMRGGAGMPLNPTSIPNAPAFGHFSFDEAEFRKAGSVVHNEFDARWKIERERMSRNGSHNSRESEASTEIHRKSKPPLQDSSQSFKLATQSGSTTNEQTDAPICSSTGSNIIKLHQPIRKSRVLVVSGLPEDTCMSIVVEAFEKLGKIKDLQKNEKGGTFTISYSSEADAVTAKRNLHRSCLAGKRITVDYVHQ